MWPDVPLAIDFDRLGRTDWCRRIPPDAVVLGKYCGAERILPDGRRHRCRLGEAHREHVCWCGRPFEQPVAEPRRRPA